MSDIGFHGLAAALVGIAMLAISAIALAVETVVWFRRRRADPRLEANQPLVFLLPSIYALLGIVILVVADRGSLDAKSFTDDLAPALAVGGLVCWLGARVWLARSARAAGPPR